MMSGRAQEKQNTHLRGTNVAHLADQQRENENDKKELHHNCFNHTGTERGGLLDVLAGE